MIPLYIYPYLFEKIFDLVYNPYIVQILERGSHYLSFYLSIYLSNRLKVMSNVYICVYAYIITSYVSIK